MNMNITMDDIQQQVLAHVSPVSLGMIAVSLASIGIYLRSRSSTTTASSLPLPPGPAPGFLFGNLADFPKDHLSDGFAEWARKYGDIVHVTIMGKHMIGIHSYELAQELLNKRPTTTGGRSNGYMFTNIMGMNWGLPSIQATPTHADVRKMLRRGIGPQRVGHHDPMIEKGAMRLVLQLAGFKGDPSPVITKGVGRLVTTVTYGQEMWNTMGEELNAWNVETMHYIGEAFFNFWPVDVFNFLRFIPTWMPGAYFKKMGKRAKQLSGLIRHEPFAKAKQLYQTGHLGHSIAADLIEEVGPVENVQDALAILYLAGSDTTAAAIIHFCHALFLFPEVAQKVYEELKTVTEGGGRLPEVKDRSKLPYTDAVWKEAFRWHPFLMLDIPHVNENDEIVKGYLIPKGSIILPNNGFMLMDPRVWGDPKVFRPERFLGPDAANLPNPLPLTFGYGLRVCPGMYLADRLGFHYAATLAALFSIVPLEGKSIPDPESIVYSDMALCLPQDFECRFVPRSEKAKHLIGALALHD